VVKISRTLADVYDVSDWFVDLVDSGVDLRLFPKQLGLDIGLSTTQGDLVDDAIT
jgi:hypothetical protein